MSLETEKLEKLHRIGLGSAISFEFEKKRNAVFSCLLYLYKYNLFESYAT